MIERTDLKGVAVGAELADAEDKFGEGARPQERLGLLVAQGLRGLLCRTTETHGSRNAPKQYDVEQRYFMAAHRSRSTLPLKQHGLQQCMHMFEGKGVVRRTSGSLPGSWERRERP